MSHFPRRTIVIVFGLFSIALVLFVADGIKTPLAALNSVHAQENSATITVAAYFPDNSSIVVPNVPASTDCKSTVRLAMLNANYLNSKFTFQTSFYYPFGDYVTEINGWYGSGSRYWSVYVNGQAAPCGIDTQTLNPGDVVAWYLISTTDEKRHVGKSFQARVFEIRRKKHAD